MESAEAQVLDACDAESVVDPLQSYTNVSIPRAPQSAQSVPSGHAA